MAKWPMTGDAFVFANDQRRMTNDGFPMGTRRKSRELALQLLFQADLGKQPIDDVRKTLWKGRGEVTPEDKGFTGGLFRVAQDGSPESDRPSEEDAEKWRIERM